LTPRKPTSAKSISIDKDDDDDDDEYMSEEEEEEETATVPREVSFIWTFVLGDENFYIILKQCPNVQYHFTVENNSSEIHVHANYTPTIEDCQMIASSLKVNTSFISPHFMPLSLKTVLIPPCTVHELPKLHTEKEGEFAVVSFPLKKTTTLTL